MRTRLVMAGLVLLLTPADPARSQAIEPVCPSPHDRTVAITFDDLPYTRAGDAGGAGTRCGREGHERSHPGRSRRS